MTTTRAKNSCAVYGIGSDLSSTQLPNVGDVMRFYVFKKSKLPKNTKVAQISADVASNVISIWNKAGIPTVSEKQVIQKMEHLRSNLRDIQRKKGKLKMSVISVAKEESVRLFDICTCHCDDLDDCDCVKECKIPALERDFLLDQRSSRRMIIAGLDKVTTSKLQKMEDRVAKRLKYYSSQTHSESSFTQCTSGVDESEEHLDVSVDLPDQSEHKCDDEPIEDVVVSSDSELWDCCPKRNIIKIPTVARECDRYGISNAAGAAIATATLIDYGVIKSGDSATVIDRAKIRRQRDKLRASLSMAEKSSLSQKGPVSLYFDGRKDNTL